MSEIQKVKTILYVEDEKNIQEELAFELQEYCEELLLAQNGQEGLEKYISGSPEIVVTDIKMPIMDGIEMVKEIKKRDHDASIVFTTAFSDIHFLIEAIELQVDGYIVKPIDLDLLDKKLSSMIQQRYLEKELKLKEKMLMQQSKLASMGEMLSNIAHQWRQPLSVISVSVSGLQVRIDNDINIDNTTLYECSNGVLDQVQYLSDTIEDFRDFIKPSNEFYIYNIKEFLLRCMKLVEASFENNEIKMLVDIDDKIESYGDPKQLLQAVVNILNNAKDALKEVKNQEKKLVFMLSAKVDDESVSITIKDNGGGIDDKIIDKIFEPYFTTKHQSVGTGLGLYITHNIITKILKGSIEASNEEFEFDNTHYKGAKFVITLPLQKAS